MYLQECLDSIINQTLEDIEIICVNDGSTDSSPGILKYYANKDGRLKLINKPNAGYGHTMNVGIEAAKGDFIGIVESDDYVKLNMFERLYEEAVKNELDFVKADFYRFTKESGQLQLQYNSITGNRQGYYNVVLNPAKNVEVFRFIMNTWSGIYRKSFLFKHRIRHNETPGASYQDNGFYFQTFCLAQRVLFINEPFYMNRRDNPDSSVKSKEKVFCMNDEYKYIKNFIDKNADLKNKFLHIYSVKKFHNYMFTYNRVDDKYKWMFLKTFSDEFSGSLEEGELDKELFTEDEWSSLISIIEEPEAYHIEHSIGQYKKKYKNMESKYKQIYNSKSYKIGRALTFLPRKLKGVLSK